MQQNFTADILDNLVAGSHGFCGLVTWYDPKKWGKSIFGSEDDFKKQFVRFDVLPPSKNSTIKLYFPAFKETFDFTKKSALKNSQMQEFYYFDESENALPRGSVVHDKLPEDLFPPQPTPQQKKKRGSERTQDDMHSKVLKKALPKDHSEIFLPKKNADRKQEPKVADRSFSEIVSQQQAAKNSVMNLVAGQSIHDSLEHLDISLGDSSSGQVGGVSPPFGLPASSVDNLGGARGISSSSGLPISNVVTPAVVPISKVRILSFTKVGFLLLVIPYEIEVLLGKMHCLILSQISLQASSKPSLYDVLVDKLRSKVQQSKTRVLVPESIVVGQHSTVSVEEKKYAGVVESFQKVDGPHTRYYWRVLFDDGDSMDLDDAQLVSSLVLWSLDNSSTVISQPVEQKKQSENLMPKMSGHILLKMGDPNIPCTIKEHFAFSTSNKYPQRECVYQKNCWYCINKDNRKHVLEMTAEGRPANRKISTFCHGCVGADGQPVMMCDMCYAFYHVQHGHWKLHAKSTVTNIWP